MTLANDQIERGRAALARLNSNSTFEDWVMVGQALKIGREEVSNTIKASGGTYSMRMTAWLKTQEFDSIDKGVRSRLLNIIDKLPEVQSWRETLSSADRLKYNHPNSIWRRFSAPKPKPRVKTTPGSSPLPPNDRVLLAEILGQLGSDQPVIISATISQATNFLAEHNVTWFDVLYQVSLTRTDAPSRADRWT
jgi:hypothetical protein